MSQFLSRLKMASFTGFLLMQTACSTIADLDMTIAGEPKTLYSDASTIVTKFMTPSEVSQYCKKILPRKQSLQWFHACTYKSDEEGIVMVIPTPGSIAPKTFGKIITHEYQHVGQALQKKKMNHKDWH